MLKTLCLTFISLFLDDILSGKTQVSTEMIIVKTGNEVFIGCEACNAASRQWTYKSPKGNQAMEDLIKGSEIIRNKFNEKGGLHYNITTKGTNCTYNLLITTIQLGDAGQFACWEGSVVLKRTNIVVINSDGACSSEPEFPHSKNIYLKQNDSIAIKCPFRYSADESCIVTPTWTDLTGHRNLTIPDDDFELNMDDKHAWIHFKSGADISNGTHVNLSFTFNCSFSNNSQDKYIRRGRYDFGHVPFTIFVEEATNVNKTTINLLLMIAIGLAIAIFAIVLVLMFAWLFYKLFYAGNFQTVEDISIVGKNLPDIPMMTELSEIVENFQLKDIAGFQFSEDATYDIINDCDEPELKCNI